MIPFFILHKIQEEQFDNRSETLYFEPQNEYTQLEYQEPTYTLKFIGGGGLLDHERDKILNFLRSRGATSTISFQDDQLGSLPMTKIMGIEPEDNILLEEITTVILRDRVGTQNGGAVTMWEDEDRPGFVGSSNLSNTLTSKDEAWRTPDYIYDYFDKIYKFNFDAAASPQNARTKKYLTKKDNALTANWCKKGRRIWLNPPYSRNLYPWIEKAYKTSQKGCLVAVLVFSRTDTKWWHDFVIPHAYKVHFIQPRIKFLHSKTGKKKGSATAPSCLIVFKPHKRKSMLVEGDEVRDT